MTDAGLLIKLIIVMTKPIENSHMKIINAKTHGILDYATVAIFALAPSVLNLSEGPMLFSYLLAIVHLSMTVLTDFSMGMVKVIPLKLHGVIEFIVGIAIPIAPFVLGFEGVALYFYLIIGIAIFIIANMTDYQEQS